MRQARCSRPAGPARIASAPPSTTTVCERLCWPGQRAASICAMPRASTGCTSSFRSMARVAMGCSSSRVDSATTCSPRPPASCNCNWPSWRWPLWWAWCWPGNWACNTLHARCRICWRACVRPLETNRWTDRCRLQRAANSPSLKPGWTPCCASSPKTRSN
ncbi:hypothetical protein D9M69_529760 [compost metagenome]